MKHCPICTKDLPVSDFGICRARPDGRNLYCRSCIREKVSATRINAARSQFKPVALPADSVVFGTALTRVRMAVKNGIRTRYGIRDATGLSIDEVCDALEVLRSKGSVRIERGADDEAYFYLLKVA